MQYIHFFETDMHDEKMGFHKKAGTIYCVTDKPNGLPSCVPMNLEELEHDIFDYLYIDGKLVYDSEGIAERHLEELRNKREGLLTAFDKYKSNVIIGIEKDISMSEEVLNWYQAILDLNEDAINNPPERIKYYLN